MLKERIKFLCRSKGISVPKLEIELGLSSGSISKWDKSSPKADNIAKVADYFGVSIDYLLERDESPTQPLLPEDVMKLAALYKQLSPDDQASVMALANHMATKK